MYYSDLYLCVSGTVAVLAAGGVKNSKKVTFKNCDPFTHSINEINSTQADNVKDIDIVMSMYNLIEFINNYLQTSGGLWQYYGDEPSLNNSGTVVDFTGGNHNS